MSKMQTMILFVLVGALGWLTGCATPEVEAVYTIAPRVVPDLKSLGPIKVETQIVLSGNAVEKRDGYSAQMLLQEDMVSRLDQEARGNIQFYDAYFGSPQGRRELADYLSSKGRAHGYATIASAPERPCSTLRLSLTLAIDRQQKGYQATYRLYDTPFRLVDSPDTVTGEPYSVPFLPGQRVSDQTVTYSLWGVLARGGMRVTLHDASGRLVYRRDFPSLSYVFQNQVSPCLPGDDMLGLLSASGRLLAPDRAAFEFSGNLWPLPTSFGIIRRLTHPCLREVIRDIIPNHQRMVLALNGSGNEQLLMLIRGGAYRDALSYADSLGTARLTAADWENSGVACECLGQLTRATYCYQTALRLNAESALATTGLKRLGH